MAVSLGLVAQGCGESESESSQGLVLVDPEVTAYKSPTPDYTEKLEELKAAALAGKRYKVDDEVETLGPVEESVAKWFCVTAWQLVANSELQRIPDAKYLADRLTVRAVLDLSDGLYTAKGRAPYLAPVGVAVDELDRVIDLRSIDPQMDRRYQKTCYGKGAPTSP